MNDLEMAVISGMARAFFVQAWASREEEAGRNYPQQEMMDDAPATPQSAVIFAAFYAGTFAQANRRSGYASLTTLLYQAAKVDGIDTEKPGFWREAENRFNNYAEEFGHCIAMQAVGHGVSWFDDHAQFVLEVPGTGYELDPDEFPPEHADEEPDEN